MEAGVHSRRNWLLAAGGALAVSCNRNTRKTIAVIPKSTSHVFWVGVESGARAAGRDFNVNIEWNGAPSETDYTRQIEILDSMIARHVDGIAVAATERKILRAGLDRAAAAGIPLTVFDSGVDSANYLSFVATDNVDAGRLAAHTLADLLGNKGKVAIIQHAPGSTSTMDREKGFEEVLARDYKGIEIVARQYSMSDRAKARAAAENILTAHPDLDGMFASAEPGSVGAALAIKARDAAAKVKLVSFDSSEMLIDALRDGTISAMVVQDPYKMGYTAVQTLVDKLNGKNPPKQIDLSARVVRKPDLEKAEIKQLLMIKT
jgi:ribose transport system substrate-binding protein